MHARKSTLTRLEEQALTADQRADIVAFLQALSDQALLEDPRFENPWPTPRKPEAK